MDKDPWKHRSKLMLCKTCMFYVEKIRSTETKSYTVIGRCRCHAPTRRGYPAVFEHDWCGNHKIDEEKI